MSNIYSDQCRSNSREPIPDLSIACLSWKEEVYWMGRQVKKAYTELLPAPITKIVDKAIESLPLIIGYLLAPRLLSLSVICVYHTIWCCAPSMLSHQTHATIGYTLSFCAAIDAVSHLNYFLVTNNSGYALYGLFKGFMALRWYQIGGLIDALIRSSAAG